MSMKSYLAQRSFTESRIFGRPWTLESLIALFLRELMAPFAADLAGASVAIVFDSLSGALSAFARVTLGRAHYEWVHRMGTWEGFHVEAQLVDVEATWCVSGSCLAGDLAVSDTPNSIGYVKMPANPGFTETLDTVVDGVIVATEPLADKVPSEIKK